MLRFHQSVSSTCVAVLALACIMHIRQRKEIVLLLDLKSKLICSHSIKLVLTVGKILCIVSLALISV